MDEQQYINNTVNEEKDQEEEARLKNTIIKIEEKINR